MKLQYFAHEFKTEWVLTCFINISRSSVLKILFAFLIELKIPPQNSNNSLANVFALHEKFKVRSCYRGISSYDEQTFEI